MGTRADAALPSGVEYAGRGWGVRPEDRKIEVDRIGAGAMNDVYRRGSSVDLVLMEDGTKGNCADVGIRRNERSPYGIPRGRVADPTGAIVRSGRQSVEAPLRSLEILAVPLPAGCSRRRVLIKAVVQR